MRCSVTDAWKETPSFGCVCGWNSRERGEDHAGGSEGLESRVAGGSGKARVDVWESLTTPTHPSTHVDPLPETVPASTSTCSPAYLALRPRCLPSHAGWSPRRPPGSLSTTTLRPRSSAPKCWRRRTRSFSSTSTPSMSPSLSTFCTELTACNIPFPSSKLVSTMQEQGPKLSLC